MKEVAGTTEAPAFWDIVEPEERIYWRANLELNTAECYFTGEVFVFYTSERAAWIDREKEISSGDYFSVGVPYEVTREEATAIAKTMSAQRVEILDEDGQVVESWSV